MLGGNITEIWRYPVKSMGGERVAVTEVDTSGIPGDRRLGVMDRASGKLLSAKTVPRLLEASATLRGSSVTITAPGLSVTSHDAGVDGVLSDWLGRSVRLAAPVAGARAVFEHEVDPDDPSQLVDLVTPPGSFFDSRSVLHVITEASLRAAAALHPDGDWDGRRFRPNLVVRAPHDGFVEDAWVGRQIEVGSVKATVRKRTGRCVLTTRAQPGIRRDPAIFRSLVNEREGSLGVYVDPLAPGQVAEGDSVTMAR